MISIVSPAKSLDFETPANTTHFSQAAFLKESEVLVQDLKKQSPQQLAQLMRISDKLAHLNADRYLAWKQPFSLANAKQAVYAFQGDVYQGLDANSFTEEDLSFAQEHFRILSGLYGVLKPLDLIQAYRLEMGTPFKNKKGKNLYAFWGKQLGEHLASELNGEVLLNLASNEYFKAVDLKALNTRVITPVFKDWKNGQYKVISFFAKKARGMMAAYQIKNRLTDPEGLKAFDAGGYQYDESLSKGDEWVFSRKQAV